MTYTNFDNSLLRGKTIFTKPAQKLTYMFLLSYNDCEKVFPSMELIAEATCQSVKNAQRVVKELECMGLIKVVRKTGKSNVYTLTKMSPLLNVPETESDVSEDNLSNVPATECPTTNTSNINTNNNTNNSNTTRDSIINDLIKRFPNIPVQEIAEGIEADSNEGKIVCKTIKQFNGLLTYRVKGYKPKATSKRKITRTEILPDWFDKAQEEVEAKQPVKDEKSEAEQQKELAELLASLKVAN